MTFLSTLGPFPVSVISKWSVSAQPVPLGSIKGAPDPEQVQSLEVGELYGLGTEQGRDPVLRGRVRDVGQATAFTLATGLGVQESLWVGRRTVAEVANLEKESRKCIVISLR